MSCDCHMGDYPTPTRFPAVEKVLINYMRGCLERGEYFWMSQELNSDTVKLSDLQGLGAFSDIFSSIVNVATKVGTATLAALPAIAQIQGTSAQLQSQYQANNVGNTIAASGVTVPQGLAPYVISATKKDVAGSSALTSNTPLLLLGAGALLLLAVAK